MGFAEGMSLKTDRDNLPGKGYQSYADLESCGWKVTSRMLRVLSHTCLTRNERIFSGGLLKQ